MLGLFGSRFGPTAETDRAVLMATLEHVAKQPESARYRDKSARKLYLHHNTLLVEHEMYVLWHRAWPRNEQLDRSLMTRNASEEPLDWSSTERVELVDTDELRKYGVPDPVDARCLVKLSRPGYSRDGRMALVAMSLQPSGHGVTVTYLLTFDGEKWTPLAWSFSFYA